MWPPRAGQTPTPGSTPDARRVSERKFVSFGYGFLERSLEWPHVPVVWVLPALIAVWGTAQPLLLLRAERDWSQAELGERLGVSRQTVNAIEQGKYNPSLPLAFRLAAVLSLSIEDIFHPETSGPPSREAP